MTCRANPPYTKAVVLSGNTSPVWGRHAGGNLERSTRSSAIDFDPHQENLEKFTKFQECDVVWMGWEVLVDNDLVHSDKFPGENNQIKCWTNKKQRNKQNNQQKNNQIQVLDKRATFALPQVSSCHKVRGWQRGSWQARALRLKSPCFKSTSLA